MAGCELIKLKNQIEDERAAMHEMSQIYSLCSEEMIEISRRIDVLHNKIESLKKGDGIHVIEQVSVLGIGIVNLVHQFEDIQGYSPVYIGEVGLCETEYLAEGVFKVFCCNSSLYAVRDRYE
ncbi:aspartyl-phosphate phosphatase Spo0E family protein [Paenibacillus alvei]|uniref:aspartyl-phosphate phosphatase Spo0E family protein n=1 Tax=Paenibacillus alvei TaxID=44250 RepID=UPI00227FF0A8|nr:aspartyl-phosphate phosphatase Spo0E family protein [Paenibacillus alvei]